MKQSVEAENRVNPILMACSIPEEGHCITCSDEALPARVVSLDPDQATALVEVEGETLEIDISLVEVVECGDILLVHGGVALTRLDPDGDAEDPATINLVTQQRAGEGSSRR